MDFSWITLSEEEQLKLSEREGKIIEAVWDDNWKTFLPKKG